MAALNSRTIRVQTIGRYQKYFDLGSLSSRIRKPAGLHTGLTMPYHVYQHMRGPRQVVSEHPQHQPAARDPGSKGSSGPLKEDKLPQYSSSSSKNYGPGGNSWGPCGQSAAIRAADNILCFCSFNIGFGALQGQLYIVRATVTNVLSANIHQ